jgi:hypothetical protein
MIIGPSGLLVVVSSLLSKAVAPAERLDEKCCCQVQRRSPTLDTAVTARSKEDEQQGHEHNTVVLIR